VILDRYFYSTIAYQGSHGGDVSALDADMHRIAPEPDLVLLLDVPPEVGLARIEDGRGETPNAFETVTSLRDARYVFRGLATRHANIVVIDGTQDIQSVHHHILWALINGPLKARFCTKAHDSNGSTSLGP